MRQWNPGCGEFVFAILTRPVFIVVACDSRDSFHSHSELSSKLLIGLLPSYRMGFSIVPPRPDTKLALKGFEIRLKYADAAIVHQGIPWNTLLKGESPEKIVNYEPLPLIDLYRSKGITVAITVEALDGLDRSEEVSELRNVGRSIVENDVQRLYRDHVLALATMTRPDYFGLAAEVNLFKANARFGREERLRRAFMRRYNVTPAQYRLHFTKTKSSRVACDASGF